MERQSHYGTVTEALDAFREQGFVIDFNLVENSIAFRDERFSVDEFEIVDVYRYEGDSDPGDEAAVYAIESHSGWKGVLVTGYGISGDELSDELLHKLGGR